MVLPTLCGLAEVNDIVFYAMANAQIQEIADLPNNCVNVFDAEPYFRNRTLPVQMLGVAAAIGYRFWDEMMHPIHSLMAHAGLDLDPNVLPTPKIKIEKERVTPYDVVLAPFAKATERSLSSEDLLELAQAIAGKYTAVVGGPHEKKRSDGAREWYDDDYYGYSFNFIANLMQKARCVVTADSFPGRLAHAAGLTTNHIILDSGATPWQTQSHPGAVRVKGWRSSDMKAHWNIEDIVSAIEGVLSERT